MLPAALSGVLPLVPPRGSGCSTSRGIDRSRRASRGVCRLRGPGGRCGSRTNRSWTSNQSAHHSHTLPVMWWSPKPFGGNASTGAVPAIPVGARCSASGSVPCQTFMRCSPPGSSSSPQGKRLPLQTAACRVLPLGLGRQSSAGPGAVGRASSHETCTTGWSPRSLEVDCRAFGMTPVGPFDLPPPRRRRRRRWLAESRRAGSRRRRTTSGPLGVGDVARRHAECAEFVPLKVTVVAPISNAVMVTSWTGVSPSRG